MKKYIVVLVVLVVAIVLTACGGQPYTSVTKIEFGPDYDEACPTGLVLTKVTVDTGYILKQGSIESFILTPNEGCYLPKQFCVVVSASGLSCTTME